MANIITRRKVLELRKRGLSYSQIRKEIKVSKSALTIWLKDYPLRPEQIYALSHNDASREKYRDTMIAKKEAELLKYYRSAQDTLFPLSNRELYFAGLFLYWGEGSKSRNSCLSISNTDPGVLQFTLLWMKEALHIPKEKISIMLHLYSDMNCNEMIEYWSNKLLIPKSQFANPYIKESKRIDIDYKGYGHGTCMVRAYDIHIKQTILMSIKAMTTYSDLRIKEFNDII